MFVLIDLKPRRIVGGPKCPTRKLSQFINILLKPFWKYIKIFIPNCFDVLIKCTRDVDEDTEIITFDVTSFCKIISHEFDLEALDYFLTTYQGNLHPRFKKELVFEFRIRELYTQRQHLNIWFLISFASKRESNEYNFCTYLCVFSYGISWN